MVRGPVCRRLSGVAVPRVCKESVFCRLLGSGVNPDRVSSVSKMTGALGRGTQPSGMSPPGVSRS
eukprot:scaffold128240_cov31-Tisochrysis_lutea.AAC.2